MIEDLRTRKSFNLNLKACQGTLTAEIIDYLNSLEDKELDVTISNTLVMCFLPLARQINNRYSSEELRITCLDCSNRLFNHASNLRQYLEISKPHFDSAYLILNNDCLEINNLEKCNQFLSFPLQNSPKKKYSRVKSKVISSLIRRLQTSEDTKLGEVIDYFGSLDKQEIKQNIIDVLTMNLLPLARAENDEYSPEELRRCCLESSELINIYINYLKQTLKVPIIQSEPIYLMISHNGTEVIKEKKPKNISPLPTLDKEKEEENSDPFSDDGRC